MNVAVKEAELKKQVSEAFYSVLYLQQKRAILQQTDSIYNGFLEKANLRFAKGETNILEKATAETQKGQIAIQLQQVQQDLEIALLQFQLMLNTAIMYVPAAEDSKVSYTAAIDSTAISRHPFILGLQQQKSIFETNTKLERSKLLPNLNIGYSNMSIRGTGADNRAYTSSDRFQAVQVGVGIPLFFGSQKAKINSARTLEMIAENNYLAGLQSFKNEYATAIKHYQMQQQTVSYYEKTALQNAALITQAANQQFVNGEINYLEWTMLINNATSIKSSYIDAINHLNQTILQLNYLTTK